MTCRALLALAVLALGGCMVGPDYERPTVPLPGSFAGAQGTAAPSVQPEWWRLFDDPTLNDLVATALANNTDIVLAVARIEEFDANLRVVNAALFPQVSLGATASRTAYSNAVAAPEPAGALLQNNLTLALSASFQIDFWGKLRRASEAARAQDLSTQYAKDVVALSTAALTAQTYFSLRSLDAQIVSTRSTLQSRNDTLVLVRRRAEGGLASDLDVRQAEGATFDAAFLLDDFIRQRELAEHLLGTLTGKLDLKLAAGDITQLPQPALPPPGLPSALLERRPDIHQAEQDLVAANAQIGVAKAQLFPAISLTGGFGGESAALASLFTLPGRIWSVGAGLAQPIFEGGMLVAQVDVEYARRKEALAAYQKTIQTSFREVSDALSNVRQYAATERDAQASVDAARSALHFANVRYEAGYVQFLEVLDSLRTLNISELALIRSRQNLLSADVDLMTALGGGWQPE